MPQAILAMMISVDQSDKVRFGECMDVLWFKSGKDIVYFHFTDAGKKQNSNKVSIFPTAYASNLRYRRQGKHGYERGCGLMAEFKTNVMRILDKAKVKYSALEYLHEDGVCKHKKKKKSTTIITIKKWY